MFLDIIERKERTMNRNQEYILTIVEEGSFSKAADRLYISQPALSIIVKKTEDELGLPLFNRTSKPITLTPAGKIYVEYIKRMQALDEQLQQELNSIREQEKGTLNIGTSNYFSSYILPELSHRFKQQYPRYTIAISEGNNPYLSQLLQSSDIDLAICLGPLDTKAFNLLPWKEEHLILAVPASYPINERLSQYRLTFADLQKHTPLEAEREAISLSHFANCDFIIMKRGNDGYTRTLSMCHNAGFKPKVSMYVDQMTTNFNAAKQGHGCAFLRTDIFDYVAETDKLFFYKINDPLTTRHINIYYKKTGDLSKTARKFIDFLKCN